MKIRVEHFRHGVKVGIEHRDANGLLTDARYSLLEYLHDGSKVVSYFTPSGKYVREKKFAPHEDYEKAWRFMWRTAVGEKG